MSTALYSAVQYNKVKYSIEEYSIIQWWIKVNYHILKQNAVPYNLYFANSEWAEPTYATESVEIGECWGGEKDR